MNVTEIIVFIILSVDNLKVTIIFMIFKQHVIGTMKYK